MNCPVHCEVVGLEHEDRKKHLNGLVLGDELLLIRMPENKIDTNAIRVETTKHDHIGYINRDLAAKIAGLLDQYQQPISAHITTIEGGSYSKRNSVSIYLKSLILIPISWQEKLNTIFMTKTYLDTSY